MKMMLAYYWPNKLLLRIVSIIVSRAFDISFHSGLSSIRDK